MSIKKRLKRYAKKMRVRFTTSCRQVIGRAGSRPSFLIIGAQRSGTSSLFRYLCVQPGVVAPIIKQTHYFDRHFERPQDWYLAHFPTASTLAACGHACGVRAISGEATPDYLYFPEVPHRVAKALPDVKLIAILRHPIYRAYSHFWMMRMLGRETCSTFEDAILCEPDRLARERENSKTQTIARSPYSYLSRGYYIDQIMRWQTFFPKDHLLILSMEELIDSPNISLAVIKKFLGLPEHTVGTLANVNPGKYLPISDETRASLTRHFQPYNERLYHLIGRDFGWN